MPSSKTNIVTLQADDSAPAGMKANWRWVRDHRHAISLLCGCYFCGDTGDLRADPACATHRRDVLRYSNLVPMMAASGPVVQ